MSTRTIEREIRVPIINRVLCRVFERISNRGVEYRRYDFAWYGFGWRREHNFQFGCRMILLWINTYKRAPIRLRWLHELGCITKAWPKGRVPRTSLLGSQVKPWLHWRVRVWRFVIGGDTPRWLQAAIQNKRDREWQAWIDSHPFADDVIGEDENWDDDDWADDAYPYEDVAAEADALRRWFVQDDDEVSMREILNEDPEPPTPPVYPIVREEG